MVGLAKKKCILPFSIVVSLAVILTVLENYHTSDWHVESAKNRHSVTFREQNKLAPPKAPKYRSNNYSTSDGQNLHPPVVAKVEPAKNLYSGTLAELIELVSPKDPKCQPDNSSSDPYSQLNTAEFTSLAELLLSYRQQHIRWRKLLLEGEVEKIRTLTWYCDDGCGGLGDRVRSIGFSLMLAMISNRLFLVQWRQPFEVDRQTNIFEPAAIDWNVDQALADKLSKLPAASVSMMMTSSSKSQRANLIEEFITRSEFRHVRIKTNIVFNGFVQLHQLLTTKTRENKGYQILMNVTRDKTPTLPDSIHGVFVRYLFKFSSPTLKKAEQILHEMNMTNVKEYVVANIRSGFVGTLNEGDFFATHSEQWEAVLDHAVNESERLGIVAPVVLSCDSEKVKSWANEHYHEKVISIPREPVHVDKMHVADKVKAEIETADELVLVNTIGVADEVNAEIETAAELVIMSRATFLDRAYTNGFTSVAVHMCPFVRSLFHYTI